MENSSRVVFFIDSSKFGKVTLNRVYHWKDINTIITDKEPNKSYLGFFKEKDIAAI